MDCSTQHRSRSHRRRHSRNHHQQDIILDFLTSLDQSKTAFQWQSEVNQINDDWHEMMQTQPESKEEASKQNASNKHVTWSEDLLDIRTISPRQSQVGKSNKVSSSEEISGTSNQEESRHLCSVGDGHCCRLKTKNIEHKNKPRILNSSPKMAFMPLLNSNL